MLESAELVTNPTGKPAGKYIKLTFNLTDAQGGNDPIYINVSDLVDVYTAKEGDWIKLTGFEFSHKTQGFFTPEGEEEPQTAFGGNVDENAIADVVIEGAGQSTKFTVPSFVVDTAGHVTAAEDRVVKVTLPAAQTITGETATTQGNYINVKVTATKGENNDNYTLSTTSNVTTQAVSTATSTANGLATASDVKTYVDAKVGAEYTATGELTMSTGRVITHNESGVITSADKATNPDMTSKKKGGVTTGENNTTTITIPIIEVNAYGHVIQLEDNSYTVTYPTSSVVAGDGIAVSPSTSGNNTAYTVGVKLNSNTNDMLTVDGNGLNLNSTWDCGEYE